MREIGNSQCGFRKRAKSLGHLVRGSSKGALDRWRLSLANSGNLALIEAAACADIVLSVGVNNCSTSVNAAGLQVLLQGHFPFELSFLKWSRGRALVSLFVYECSKLKPWPARLLQCAFLASVL